MTVQKDVTKNIYVGNGSTRTFPFTFECPAEHPEYIKVYLMQDDGTALATSDYQLDMDARLITYPSSGTALPEGKKLVIMRELPLQQMMNLVNNGPYFAEDVETAFDENVMAMQQIAEKLNRSIIMSVDIDGDAFVNEVPFEAGKSFRIADDGKSIVLTEDPAKVLPLAQGVYAQTQTQAQNAIASAAAAAKSENSSAASASAADNSAQFASAYAANAAQNAELASVYKQEALTAKNDAAASATNAKASEANAKTSENNAEASKEAAQSAANSASNFATDARSSASEAKSYRDAASTYATNAKNYSENVNVFVPSVSSAGVLSWTNKAGLTNPTTVNIKGAKGDKGDPGTGITIKGKYDSLSALQAAHPKADEGDAYMAGTNLYVWNGSAWVDCGNIQGPKGDKGDTGAKGDTGERGPQGLQGVQGPAGNAATITIGSVTTSAPGTAAKVTNSGTSSAAVLDFVLPKGKDGADGGVTVDDALSSTSTNPVQNNVIYNALLNKVGTDIFSGFALIGAATTIAWRQGSQAVGSINASSYTGTAAAATQDSEGNVITDTYAKKTDVSGLVKSVNNTKPDSNGNVTIAVSGGSSVTVDTTLSATSTNAIANKAVYAALSDKLGKTETAYAATKATQDSVGNVIADTYAKKSDVSNMTIDTTLSATSTNAIQNKAVYDALQTKLSKTDNVATATRALQDGRGNIISSTYVKTINNIRPDSDGNVTITASGGGGVSTSKTNTWTAQQTFNLLGIVIEKYSLKSVTGTAADPTVSVASYTATGNFTLNLANLTAKLSNNQATVFTAQISSGADYALTISGAGTVKYIGSASDVAITSAGLLLNILMTKDSYGSLTSIVQANKLT